MKSFVIFTADHHRGAGEASEYWTATHGNQRLVEGGKHAPQICVVEHGSNVLCVVYTYVYVVVCVCVCVFLVCT